MMQRRISLLAAVVAICTAGPSLSIAQSVAQSVGSPGSADPSFTQTQPAPIEHAYPRQNRPPYGHAPYSHRMPAQGTLSPGATISAANMPLTANPAPGVILRVGPNSAVNEVSLDSSRLELRVESGIVNVNVHDPQKDILLLVDLPGGQTQMLKNGLYTFNATTNTTRVLKGEALAFPASNAGAEPMKVKEYNKVEFGKDSRPHEFVPQQAIADMILGPRGGEYSGGSMYGPPSAYGYAPYGDGYSPYYDYPYPYYGFVRPWPWWDPYGGFYPYGVGIGFGYYGGWGYHGGFHGGGFHGRR